MNGYPTVDKHQIEWINAERELAINTIQNTAWSSLPTQYPVWPNNMDEPLDNEKPVENGQM